LKIAMHEWRRGSGKSSYTNLAGLGRFRFEKTS